MTSPISIHVLDTASNCPGVGMSIRLYTEDGRDSWQLIASGISGDDGCITNLLPQDHAVPAGNYRIRFNIGEYFAANETDGFFPYADIVFRVVNEEDLFHIQLKVSPTGYSTSGVVGERKNAHECVISFAQKDNHK